jgi:hypothetical protein
MKLLLGVVLGFLIGWGVRWFSRPRPLSRLVMARRGYEVCMGCDGAGSNPCITCGGKGCYNTTRYADRQGKPIGDVDPAAAPYQPPENTTSVMSRGEVDR